MKLRLPSRPVAQTSRSVISSISQTAHKATGLPSLSLGTFTIAEAHIQPRYEHVSRRGGSWRALRSMWRWGLSLGHSGRRWELGWQGLAEEPSSFTPGDSF